MQSPECGLRGGPGTGPFLAVALPLRRRRIRRFPQVVSNLFCIQHVDSGTRTRLLTAYLGEFSTLRGIIPCPNDVHAVSYRVPMTCMPYHTVRACGITPRPDDVHAVSYRVRMTMTFVRYRTVSE
eukprot:Polyplicarium_translucidae@DN2478_c1_g1_i10.p2